MTKKLQVNLESEISILKAVHHPHIVGLIECQVCVELDESDLFINPFMHRKLKDISILLWNIVLWVILHNTSKGNDRVKEQEEVYQNTLFVIFSSNLVSGVMGN